MKDRKDYVDRADIVGVTVEWLQLIFDEDSTDDMMCLSYPVSLFQAQELIPHVAHKIDLQVFDYFVSGWAERGFRTPGGFYPPPKDPPAFFEGAVRVRPVTAKNRPRAPRLH